MLEGESLVRFPFPSGKPLGLASTLSMHLSKAALSRTASRRSVRVLVNIWLAAARVLLNMDRTYDWWVLADMASNGCRNMTYYELRAHKRHRRLSGFSSPKSSRLSAKDGVRLVGLVARHWPKWVLEKSPIRFALGLLASLNDPR